MKKAKKASIFLTMALALLLSMVPVYAAETAPADDEVLMTETADAEESGDLAASEDLEASEEAPAEGEEGGAKKPNMLLNIALVVVVVAVLAIAFIEIRRDNNRKEPRG